MLFKHRRLFLYEFNRKSSRIELATVKKYKTVYIF